MGSLLEPSPPPSSPAVTSVMRANKGRNTRLELSLRAGLRAEGLRGYRINYRIERLHFDLAFPDVKVAVSIHGCWWHSCQICNLPLPKTNSKFWEKKFYLNRQRDQRARRLLEASRWDLVEIWEHEWAQSPDQCVGRIANAVRLKRLRSQSEC